MGVAVRIQAQRDMAWLIEPRHPLDIAERREQGFNGVSSQATCQLAEEARVLRGGSIVKAEVSPPCTDA